LTGTELRQRRKVYTGEAFWVLHARRRQSSHRTHYGMRIVCSACAAKLDFGRGAYKSAATRAKWFMTMMILLVLFVAGLLLVLRVIAP